MLYAIQNGEKVLPKPNQHALCPFCRERVTSKCGSIKAWHWAHVKGKACDSWYEPESLWHRNWKFSFGKENCEVRITKGDHWHVADIFTNGEVVIELQNSPIQKETIRQREDFYGERMIWIVNGAKFRSNFYLKQLDDDSIIEFKWDYPKRSWEDCRRPVFIDLNDDFLFWVRNGMGTKLGQGVLVSKEKFINKYGGDFKVYSDLLRTRTFILERKKIVDSKLTENGFNILISCIDGGKPRMLEIYFENLSYFLEIKNYRRFVVQGILNNQDSGGNLKLLKSKVVGIK